MNELEKLVQEMRKEFHEAVEGRISDECADEWANRLTELSKTHALVPREPTGAMIEACKDGNILSIAAYHVDAYKAMIAAAESDQ